MSLEEAEQDGWARVLVEALQESLAELSVSDLRSLASDLAWAARSRGFAIDVIERSRTHWSIRSGLLAVYLIAQHARFDFHFVELQYLCNQALSQTEWSDDALLLANAGLAALGMRHEAGASFVDRSLESTNADWRSRHACLHALWFANHLEDQAERILAVSEEMLARGEGNANVHFRRAFAFRRRGDFEAALSAIDQAIALHRGSPAVHQDYVRERELIVTMSLTENRLRSLASDLEATMIETADDLRQTLREHLESREELVDTKVDLARTAMNDALAKNVEMLGLFVTLVTFVLGTGASYFYSEGISVKVVTTVSLLIGTYFFFCILRWVILSETPPTPRAIFSRWIRLRRPSSNNPSG